MSTTIFEPQLLKTLYIPASNSNGEDNGQVTIIGGSKLFHGSPIFALTAASRIVDMVFFATPEESIGRVAENLKSKLSSFIWIPWEDRYDYADKSDALLIGPGLMHYGRERTRAHLKKHPHTGEGKFSKKISEQFLKKFSHKRWVIDAGSLQTIDPEWIPRNAIITPNQKEFKTLFGMYPTLDNAQIKAQQYNCIIVLKGPETFICSPTQSVAVHGGNAGLTKGGTGDVLAGLTVALLAKNDPFLAACCASYVIKHAAEELEKEIGLQYNSDDLAEYIPKSFKKLQNSH